MAKYCVTVSRDDSDPSVFGSARIGGVCVLPVTSGTEETHTLSSYGISSNHTTLRHGRPHLGQEDTEFERSSKPRGPRRE